MKKRSKTVPKDYHSVTPILVLRDALEAIEFYKKAFGAKVMFRQNRSDGKLMHAALKIGDSIIMMGEECPPHEGHEKDCVRSPAELGGTTTTLYLYVKEADKMFAKAQKAGGDVIMPMADMFWGDRMGMLRDPFGHSWAVAVHIEDLTPRQMKKRMEEACGQCGEQI